MVLSGVPEHTAGPGTGCFYNIFISIHLSFPSRFQSWRMQWARVWNLSYRHRFTSMSMDVWMIDRYIHTERVLLSSKLKDWNAELQDAFTSSKSSICSVFKILSASDHPKLHTEWWEVCDARNQVVIIMIIIRKLSPTLPQIHQPETIKTRSKRHYYHHNVCSLLNKMLENYVDHKYFTDFKYWISKHLFCWQLQLTIQMFISRFCFVAISYHRDQLLNIAL